MKDDNDIKNILKSNIENNIKAYSHDQLNEIVIKSAKKSMCRVFPGWIIVACIMVIIFLSWIIFSKIQSPGLGLVFIIFNLTLIYFLVTILILVAWQIKKVTECRPDAPIRDWLKRCIHWMDQQIDFTRKYGTCLDVIAFIVGLSIGQLYNYFYTGSVNLIGILISALIIFLILYASKKLQNKRLYEIRNRLQELYDQIDE